MSTTLSPIERLTGKAEAELWRGTGIFPEQPHPVDLEPPLPQYDEHHLNSWDCFYNDWNDSTIKLPPAPYAGDHQELSAIIISQFSGDDTTLPRANQFLLSLSNLERPASFEITGFGGNTNSPASAVICFICHQFDTPLLQHQLQAHYPNSGIESRTLNHNDMELSLMLHQEEAEGAILCLNVSHLLPIQTFTNLNVDPLLVILTALDQLPPNNRAMLQVLFTPTTGDWAHTLHSALINPYKHGGDFLFSDINQADFNQKFSSPLFAVSIRLASSDPDVMQHLIGYIEQFANPPQSFRYITDDATLPNAVGARTTFRPGIILSTEELAGFIHLPAKDIISERLNRITLRTKQAPPTTQDQTPGSVLLGHNIHRGKKKEARIPGNMRPRHCYIAGKSGTGKSTLLLNMIKADIEAGRGVGVLDPHGDLVQQVLSLIPEQRIQDVAYFNPTDLEHPPAFNIIECKTDTEQERLALETITTIRNFYPDAWGVRINQILSHAIPAILTTTNNGTINEVRRLLIDQAFRECDIIPRLRDPFLKSFWQEAYPALPKDANQPVLNKLDLFITQRVLRNVVCQRRGKFDFDFIINTKQIFLANLSKGLLTDKIAGVFGTFLMSKIINATFRRANTPEERRVPFYLYIDEFQNFTDLAISFEQILAEARKYKLILTMANQYVGQLPDTVKQAIFGNVGTLITFQLGVQDSNLIAHEFADFTNEEIRSLERGQALARIGGIQNSFNLSTPPPPKLQDQQYVQAIIEQSQERYTTPRAKVEKAFAKQTGDATRIDTAHATHSTSSLRQAQGRQNKPEPAKPSQPPPEPEFLKPEGLEDDFVV